jgi:hypothetical protein
MDDKTARALKAFHQSLDRYGGTYQALSDVEKDRDLDVALDRANKSELRAVVRRYRFLALSLGVDVEWLDEFEKETVHSSRFG